MAFDKTIQALREGEANHWTVADALVAEVGSGSRNWDNLADALALEGLEFQVSTLKAYRRVAASFTPDSRVPGVSFAAHQAAITLGDVPLATQAIQRAKTNSGKATRDSVLAEVRQMKGRTGNDTSDAVIAWRDLRRGVKAILALPRAELEALLAMDEGANLGQAPDLSRDLAKVSMAISEATKKAEDRMARAKAAKARGKATKAPASKAPAKAPEAPVEAVKPKIGRLGQGRGIG